MMFAIIKKELLQLIRDPRLLTMLLIMPVILVVLFGMALKLEPKQVKMAFYDADHSVFSLQVKTGLWSSGYFELYEVDSRQAVIEEIRSGRAKAGLEIKQDFSAKLIENQQPHIRILVDGTMPSLSTAMKYHSQDADDESVTNSMYFQDADAENVVIAQQPFIVDTEILFNPESRETWFFLPGVIGVLIMQVALILTGISFVREREKGTLEQLLVTPISRLSLITGKLLPYIVITLIEFYLVLGISWYLFDLPQPSSHFILLLLALLYVAVMISLGLFISLISKTQQQAMFIAIFIVVPSILLSGFIFPLEAIPDNIRPISYLFPFTYFIEIIRDLLIKHSEWQDILPSLLSLAVFMLIFILASHYKFKKLL